MSDLDQALRLVEEGELDPLVAIRNQRKLREMLRAIKDHGQASPPLAGLGRQTEPLFASIGVTHIVRLDGVAPVEPGRTVGPLKLEWPGGEGMVKSLFAGTVDGEVQSLSRVACRISINGSDELFTTGQSEAYVPLVAFQAQNHNWFRLRDYPVTANQRWNVYFRNEDTSIAAALVPFLLFGFERR